MAPMRFSLSILPFFDPDDAQPYRRTFALCELAESLGYDTVMVGHHHFMRGQISDPFSLLAAIAARTERLRVATAIFLLPLHHPLQVAERVATLDQLSGGRVSLGVGSGWSPAEYAAFGATLSERGARMDESLQLLRRLWTEENVAGDGQFWRFPALSVYPRPVQKPHPPLWVAGNAAAAIESAARLGTHWLCDPVQTTERIVELHGAYARACAALEVAPAWVLRRYVWLGRDRAEMERDFLPDFVGRQLAYWRESTEGAADRRLFARIDAGERVSERGRRDRRDQRMPSTHRGRPHQRRVWWGIERAARGVGVAGGLRGDAPDDRTLRARGDAGLRGRGSGQLRRYTRPVRTRGNCPECRLRDTTHTVSDPGATPVDLCGHCASAYDQRFVVRFTPRP
jgi:probable F420-dependent oxidoreductase